MDTFARGLRAVEKLKKDGVYDKWVAARYATYDSGIGKKIEDAKTSFVELEKYVLEKGEATRTSGKQEKFEWLINNYV